MSDTNYFLFFSILMIIVTILFVPYSKNFSKEKPKFVVHLGGMSLDHVVNEENTNLMMERAVDNFKKLKFPNFKL